MRLKGNTALVTGASRGIGRAIAIAFAREGANAIVNYLNSEHEANQVVTLINNIGKRAIPIRADVSQTEDVKKMVSQALDQFGKIDTLVNNAGIILPFGLGRPNYVNWQRMIDVNIKGILLCSAEVVDQMRSQDGGKIINITVYETRGSFGYIMTKAAGDVITRGLAREFAPQIQVNAIAPGSIDTGYISALPPEDQRQLRDRIPLKRWGQPEDVAKVAVFLASEDASWMTGTTILVDGGEFLYS